MMNKGDNAKAAPLRVFLVGVPRSGTTLLQSMLAAHPDIASFTESHFFSMHFRYSKAAQRYELTQDPTDRVHKFLEENGVTHGACGGVDSDLPGGRDWPADHEPVAVASSFIRLLDDIAAASASRHRGAEKEGGRRRSQ